MHMRTLRRACFALLFCLGTHANAATPTPAPSPFLDATPCFSHDYDDWMARLAGKGGADASKIAMIQRKFPRSQYEGAQQKFDCNAIRYESDGLTILGWMAAPKRAPIGRLPVVSRQRPHRLIGIITRSDVLSVFQRHLKESQLQSPTISLFKGNGKKPAKPQPV